MCSQTATAYAHLIKTFVTLVIASKLSVVSGQRDGWGQWSEYSDCSRTCGTGVQHRTRQCLIERSASSQCHGQDVQYQSCNTQECPSPSIDFRTFQCNSQLSLPHGNNNFVSWQSHYDPSVPCALICKSNNEEVKDLNMTVSDGTTCDNLDSFGVCVNGSCKPVGCDHVLGSKKKEDRCLVCGGNGKLCHTVSGSSRNLTFQLDKQTAFTTIPAGATRITVTLMSVTPSAVVLKSKSGKSLALTDALTEFSPKKPADFAGTCFTYKSVQNGMAVTARGPLNETLQILVSKMVRAENHVRSKRQARVGSHSSFIDFEYNINQHRTPDRNNQQHYSWVFGSWTSCSQECGGGYQLRAVNCIDRTTNGAASLHHCPQNEMPVRNQTCNELPCNTSSNNEYKWIAGHWGECSVECGVGEQTQLMHCMQTSATGTSSYTSDDICLKHVGAKPALWRACSGDGDNCPYWATGSWSECSVTCGFGKQLRSIYCQQDPEDDSKDPVVLDNTLCPTDSKPSHIQLCSFHHCADGSNSDRAAIEHLMRTSSPVVDCRTSRFGCCKDNITPAKGSSFFGCSDRVDGQVSDPCAMPNDRGPCVNYTIKWYYDTTEKQCLRFWYGGCPGNDNRFDDQETCRSKCHSKSIKTPGNPHTCAGSSYGCCGDGVTSAKGPNREGCPEFNIIGGCAGTRYGCCEDDVTSAEGPNREGCPEFNRVGGCAGTRYGCCDDSLTSATGPNKEGCRKRLIIGGCAGTRYGCCADGITSALGEKSLGCAENPITSCEASQYGCCQDRITAASGPNRQGCPGEILVSCVTSAYGCCADGVTAAQGLNGEGCPSFNRDFCQQPKDAGTCAVYAFQWHFESASGKCRQFWYGGCGGNQNRFSTKEECEAKCIQAEKTGKKLACSSSPCQNGFVCQDYHNGSYSCSCNPDWGKNCESPPAYWCFSESECGWGLKCIRTRQCKDGYCRIYAKCSAAGRQYACDAPKCSSSQDCVNDDSFEDGFFCENRISYTRPFKVVLSCSVSENGCCQDQRTPAEGPNYQGCNKKCEDTTYGCCSDGTTPAEGPNQEGCEFGSGDQPCEYTKYGCCADGMTAASGLLGRGCGDTPDSEDRVTVPSRTHTSSKKEETVIKHEKCTAPSSNEKCTEYAIKWRFDNGKHECVRHWWGGCKKNGNVFDSQKDCESECMNTIVITTPATKEAEKCTATASNDLCAEYVIKWRFDDKSQGCIRHWWGGCNRNGNVFDSQEDCESECVKTVVISNPVTEDPDFVSICDMPKDEGPCTEKFVRYYYDSRDRRCRDFMYGGCQGNENNFIEIEECQRECMGGVVRPHEPVHGLVTVSPDRAFTSAPPTTAKPDSGVGSSISISGQSTAEKGSTVKIKCKAVGPSQPTEIDWFLNGQLVTNDQSGLSVHSFVDLDSNNALISELTVRNIGSSHEGTYFCRSRPYGDLEKVVLAVVDQSSKETSTGSKDSQDPAEVCFKPMEVGPCRAAIPRFYFDSRTGLCLNFLYGGCQGNLNNFLTKEACDQKCSIYKHGGEKEEDVCQLNPEKGNCRGYNIKWHYSPTRNRCARFVYTGCDGNGNQFDTEQQCTAKCVKTEPLPDSRATEPPVFHRVSTTAGRPRSCHYSAFGCCDDGATAAVDSQRSNCEDYNVIVRPGTRGNQTVILVRPGADAFLVCTLRGQDVLWYRDGFSLQSNRLIQVFDNGTLALRRVTDDLAGTYTCRTSVGNNIPQFERFRVEINAPLRVLPGPALISVKPGDNAFLHCHAVGSPQARISWNKSGKVLRSDGHYSVFGNGTLIIYDMQAEDAGTYECLAENGVSSPATRKTNINIKEIIGANIQSHQGIFMEGETIHLHCRGTGYPPPQLEWMKEGNIMKSDEKHTVNGGDLTVRSASIDDAGMYKCIASNGQSRAQDVTTVQIKFHSPHTKCEDTMNRTKCHLIVTGKLCGFRIFGNKCCLSCKRAGLL